MPFIVKVLMKGQMKTFNNAEKIEKVMKKEAEKLPEPDKKLIMDKKILDIMIAEAKEAFRNGVNGPTYEGKIYARPWGFDLRDISPDLQVYIWQGEFFVN